MVSWSFFTTRVPAHRLHLSGAYIFEGIKSKILALVSQCSNSRTPRHSESNRQMCN
jgi:hypothetical protein